MPQIVDSQQLGDIERLSGTQSDAKLLQKPLCLDIAIVLGEGPVKPILFPQELTQKQQHDWSQFIKDPLPTQEPDFFVMEGKHELEYVSKIESNNSLKDSEKAELIAEKR